MIFLGLTDTEKEERLTKYCQTNSIQKIFILSPNRFRPSFNLPCETEHIEWSQIIEYHFFYRLLQEIKNSTLVVVNECLRTQNRNDLTYNCIRHFLNQTKHQIIFQYLPLIDTFEDFMTLFDFDTRSRWKRESFRTDLLNECTLEIKPINLSWNATLIQTDSKTKEAYSREKNKLIANVGLRDPHTIPRNLYLISGKSKIKHISPNLQYVGRNNRFNLNNLHTFKEITTKENFTVFELCHNFIDLIDFLTISRQTHIPILVSDLKVDQWYFERYQNWDQRLKDAYSALQR
jgi:hypothetical protein